MARKARNAIGVLMVESGFKNNQQQRVYGSDNKEIIPLRARNLKSHKSFVNNMRAIRGKEQLFN